ncbi:MAG: hypothetical protein WBA20_05700 [Ketobacter sp.]|nr:MAG: hypothetical protein D6160_06905 [Ketobacter sp.]
MQLQDNTIKAAWIGVGGLVLAAVITGLFMLSNNDSGQTTYGPNSPAVRDVNGPVTIGNNNSVKQDSSLPLEQTEQQP